MATTSAASLACGQSSPRIAGSSEPGPGPDDGLPSGAMDRFQYLALMGICVLVTLPLELVLGARVWRQPRRLIRALALPAAVFVVWDAVAIHRHHWSYDPRYVTGWDLPF